MLRSPKPLSVIMGISRYEKLMTRLRSIATRICIMKCCPTRRINESLLLVFKFRGSFKEFKEVNEFNEFNEFREQNP